MSSDLIKILVINHKRLWYISINFFKHRWCNFEVIHKFVPKSKMYSVWSTVQSHINCLYWMAMLIQVRISTLFKIN